MKKFADLLVSLSLLCILLAIIGAAGYDIWLASTQWVLVGGVLAIWGVYARLRE